MRSYLCFEMPADDLLRPATWRDCCVLSARGTWERGICAGLLDAALLPFRPWERLLAFNMPEGRLACEASGLHMQHGKHRGLRSGGQTLLWLTVERVVHLVEHVTFVIKELQ